MNKKADNELESELTNKSNNKLKSESISESNGASNSEINSEVKKSRLDKDSEIYKSDHIDKMDKKLWESMSKKEKLVFFKDYYLKYLIIAIIIMPIIIFFVKDMTKTSAKESLRCGLLDDIYLNPNLEGEFKDDLWYYMSRDESYMGSKNKDTMYFKTYTSTFADDIEINGFLDKNKFDVLIMSQKTFQSYAESCILTDLESVLPENVLEKLKDQLLYVKDRNGKEAAYGINMSRDMLELYSNEGKPVDSAIYTIPNNTKRLDAAVELIKFLALRNAE